MTDEREALPEPVAYIDAVKAMRLGQKIPMLTMLTVHRAFPEDVMLYTSAQLQAYGDARAKAARERAMEEAPPGLLMSMAIRYDHALGCPGYYDSELFSATNITHAQRLEATIRIMRQLWEEVAGKGFYRPEKESEYNAIRAIAAPGAGKETGDA